MNSFSTLSTPPRGKKIKLKSIDLNFAIDNCSKAYNCHHPLITLFYVIVSAMCKWLKSLPVKNRNKLQIEKRTPSPNKATRVCFPLWGLYYHHYFITCKKMPFLNEYIESCIQERNLKNWFLYYSTTTTTLPLLQPYTATTTSERVIYP